MSRARSLFSGASIVFTDRRTEERDEADLLHVPYRWSSMIEWQEGPACSCARTRCAQRESSRPRSGGRRPCRHDAIAKPRKRSRARHGRALELREGQTPGIDEDRRDRKYVSACTSRSPPSPRHRTGVSRADATRVQRSHAAPAARRGASAARGARGAAAKERETEDPGCEHVAYTLRQAVGMRRSYLLPRPGMP